MTSRNVLSKSTSENKLWIIVINCADCGDSYLQILFPLLACGLSLLYIATQLVQDITKFSRKRGYTPLNGTTHIFDHSKDTVGDGEEADDAGEVDEEDSDNRLNLKKTTSTTQSVAKVSYPRGTVLLVVVEILGLLGEIGISFGALTIHARARHAKVATISRFCVWTYILVLTCLRLVLPNTRHNFLPKLWNHTAALYCLQWLLTVILFRSSIIHPRSQLAHAIAAADFALASLLALIATTERKGNRAVLLKYEGNLEPSHEPLASLFSLATFSWVDAIVWKGYMKTFELSDVWNLRPRDRVDSVLAEFRQIRKTSRLAWRLLKHFKRHLLIQQCWAVLSALLTFAPTLLLKAILEYVERPEDTTAATAWLWVILLAVVGMMSGVSDGQSLWIGRKICIRLRAIMVGEMYAKTLRRRAAVAIDASSLEEKANSTQEQSAGKSGLKDKLVSLFRIKKETPIRLSKSENDKDEQITAGTIINLMSVDSFKVSEVSAYIHFLIPAVPVQLVVVVTLLYWILGWSSIAGIAVMLAVLPLNIIFARQFSTVQKSIMAGTDGRIHTTNEILQNIRIIKYFAWEQRFAYNVDQKRGVELRALRKKYIIWTCAATIWSGVPMLITGFSFFLYTAVEKKPLLPSVAFTALSLFGLLRYPLDRLADMTAHVLESKVSVDRVEAFLDEEETGKYVQLSGSPENEEDASNNVIGFDNATLTWASTKEQAGTEYPAFRMINLDVKFHTGSLNIIAGPTGSGKTSLLMALLGEMTLLKGAVHLPCGSREDLQIDPITGLTESVAYCAQQAWLVNDTIKQNILFASAYDEDRYNRVIEACALKRDLEVLDAGDATFVGEKGIVVSGGQKQRISLARALYSKSKNVLLDDCLSAVDSHTAQHIFEHCILGPLMYNRTCILVTHNIALCVPRSHYIIVLANGKIVAEGDPRKVMASGVLGDDLSRPTSKSGTRQPSRTNSQTQLGEESHEPNGTFNGHKNGLAKDLKAKTQTNDSDNDTDTRTEGKVEGAIGWRVYSMYFASMGSVPYWILTIFTFAIEPISQVSTNLWIREWAKSYRTRDVGITGALAHSDVDYGSFVWKAFPFGSTETRLIRWNTPYLSTPSSGVYASTGASEVDISYYLGIYAFLAVIYVLVCIFRLLTLFYGALCASRTIHTSLLDAVLRAKFKFFDTTPLGQIMNRFSKDLQAIDQEVALVAGGMVQGILNIVAVVTLISAITPGFLIAGLMLSIIYFCIGLFYIRSSRDLKRLESVQRSPLYQQFGETLSGIITIRAYGDERRFVRDIFARINAHNRPFIYLWAANRWLALRIDFAGGKHPSAVALSSRLCPSIMY